MLLLESAKAERVTVSDVAELDLLVANCTMAPEPLDPEVSTPENSHTDHVTWSCALPQVIVIAPDEGEEPIDLQRVVLHLPPLVYSPVEPTITQVKPLPERPDGSALATALSADMAMSISLLPPGDMEAVEVDNPPKASLPDVRALGVIDI